MGGQDLLDQRRAGARQADDEDRPGIGVAPIPAARQKIRREAGDDRVDEPRMPIGVINPPCAVRAAARSRLAVSTIGAARS